jgi:hypothetical protein
MAAFPCCTDETRRPGMQARRFGDQPSRVVRMCTTGQPVEQPVSAAVLRRPPSVFSGPSPVARLPPSATRSEHRWAAALRKT